MRSSRNHFHPLEEDQELEAVAVEQTAPRRMSLRSSFDIRRSSSRSRASTDNIQDPDTAGWPFSYSAPTTTNGRQSHYYSPVTPSPSKPRPVQVRSSSPRCNTPSVAAFYNYTGDGVTRHQQETIPNYMAATESARARARSNSAPRQRPGTPEIDRVGSVKKRLAFPAPTATERYYGRNNLRSPSFKSVAGRLEEMSNVSSVTSCGGGEISPASTTDLRRWFR